MAIGHDQRGFVSHAFMMGAIFFCIGAVALVVGFPMIEKGNAPGWVGWGMVGSGLGLWLGFTLSLLSSASFVKKERTASALSRSSSSLLWLSFAGFIASLFLAGILRNP